MAPGKLAIRISAMESAGDGSTPKLTSPSIDTRLPVASSILELLRVSAPDAPLGPGWIPDDEDTVPAPF